MQLKTIILMTALAAAIGLTTGGAYYWLTAEQGGGPEMGALQAPAQAPVAGDQFFSMHEAPQPIPELHFVNGESRELTLDAFEGKAVLLNVWATWCTPCREEMPALDRLQAKLGGPEFEVVPLSIDREGLPAVAAFYRELGLAELGIYLDESGRAAPQLGAVGIPTTLLINPEGQEVGRLLGPAEWDSPEMVSLLQSQVKQMSAANAR